MCSPLEKKISESWSRIDPNTFKVHARNYARDKKKEFAANHAIPLYPATIFQNEYDGPGMNFVIYCKPSENYSDLPIYFRENIKRIVANETEKINCFAIDTNVPFRERLKALGRVVNVDDLQLSSAERNLCMLTTRSRFFCARRMSFTWEKVLFELERPHTSMMIHSQNV